MYALELKSGSMVIPLSILIVLMAVGLILTCRLKESKIIIASGKPIEEPADTPAGVS
jgi:hypothetical protein